MPKTFKNKKVIISKKELKSKNHKKTNVGRIKIQKRRTIRGRNNNRWSVNRQRSISRKSINKRNISIRKRTKKNMKGGVAGKKERGTGKKKQSKIETTLKILNDHKYKKIKK